MEESTNSFEYAPINPLTNEIRLLVLQPHAKTAPREQVRCTLFNTTLNDPTHPKYEAMSYVWGDPSATKPILLHDKPFKVTRALWVALRHLRLEDRPRIIWVDAICINQNDIEEREKHVARMSEVYKNASRSVLWMDIAAERIQRILPLLKRDYPQEERPATDFAFDLINSVDAGVLKEFNLLCANPVWGRSWIVQELVLSPTIEATIQGASFNVLNLQYLAMAACRYQFGGIQRLPPEQRIPFNTANQMCTAAAYYKTSDPPVTSVLRAWQYFSSCRSTDPRDRLYAVLSIAGDTLGITVDYRIPPKELFANVARRSICQSKTLDVLCLGFLQNMPMSDISRNQYLSEDSARAEEEIKASLRMAHDAILPSWLPVFTVVGATSSSIAVLGLEARYSARQSSSVPNFEQVNTFTDPDVLTLSGMRIETVGPIETSLYEYAHDNGATLLRNFIASMPTDRYPRTYCFTGEDSFNAYWRCSIFDKACTVGRLDPEYWTSYRQIAASLIAQQALLQSTDYRSHPFITELEAGYPLLPSRDVVYGMQLFRESLGRLVNYRFHITRSGYMTMIPRGTEEGDLMCILLGSQLVHILRPVPDPKASNTFRMIGIAYIHGLMDGEALEKCERGELLVETFHLI